MAKAKKIALKKPPANKYDEELAIKDSFAGVSEVVNKNKEDKNKSAPNDLEDYQESDERELGGEG